MKININHTVRVKLTDKGKEIMEDQRQPFPKVDEDGYHHFQLWVLMAIFGQHMYAGIVDMPFETTIYYDEPPELT